MNWPETQTFPAQANPYAPYEEEAQETSLKARATQALNTGEEYVRERPVTTVLTALFLGALVGVLLRQLTRHEEEENMAQRKIGAARSWMSDAYDSMREQLHEGQDRGSRGLNAARGWLSHAYDDVRERAHDVPDRSAQGLRAAKSWLSHAYDEARDRAQDVAHDVRERAKHVHLPRFRREPTFAEKVEAALGRLRFW